MNISAPSQKTLVFLAIAAGAMAASDVSLAQSTVTWGAPQDTTSASDVAPGGAVLEARNGIIFVTYLSDNPTLDVTIDGVLFDATNFLGRQFANEPAGSFLGGRSSGDTDYDSLIGNVTSCDPATLGNGSTQTSANYEITGLTLNENYLIQAWYTDVRSISNTRELTVDGQVTMFSGSSTDANDFGRFVVGTFTAGAATQIVNFDTLGTSGRAAVSAVMVRVDDGGGLGSSFCGPATANSTGASATISAAGSAIAADNDVTLQVGSLPNNSTGFFIISDGQTVVMNLGGSLGNICIASLTLGRYNAMAQNTGMGDSVSLALDLTFTPIQPGGPIAITAGQTWNWQYWFRDTVGTTAASNFSDALSITFQ